MRALVPRTTGLSQVPQPHSAGRLDAAIALAVLTVTGLPLLGLGPDQCSDCSPYPAWAYLAVVAQSAPLVLRRRWPFTVNMVVAAATIAYGIADLPDPPVAYGALVALYSAALYCSRPLAYLTLVLAMLSVPAAVALSRGPTDAADYLNNLLVVATAWLLGYAAWARQVSTQLTRERAEQIQANTAAESLRAAAEERNRIAREMHDVLTHSVTLMVVQAEAGSTVAEVDSARTVFGSIGRIGRATLVELRSLLGALHTDHDGPGRAPALDARALPKLVADAADAGLRVESSLSGDWAHLGTATSMAAYRITQEALTNALRHGAGQPCVLDVGYDDEALNIRVSNQLPRRHSARTAGVPGRGLAGMAERASAVGGNLTAGPRGDEWVVEARLPSGPGS